jgi:hypothetical protein
MEILAICRISRMFLTFLNIIKCTEEVDMQ